MFDEIECAFRLYNGAVFHADERERSPCAFRLKVGSTMLVRFDPVDGRNIIRGLQVYEERFTIGNVRSIEATDLILTTGVRFDLSTLAAIPELNPGDTVEIEFTQTVDRINIVLSLNLIDREAVEGPR